KSRARGRSRVARAEHLAALLEALAQVRARVVPGGPQGLHLLAREDPGELAVGPLGDSLQVALGLAQLPEARALAFRLLDAALLQDRAALGDAPADDRLHRGALLGRQVETLDQLLQAVAARRERIRL